MPVPAPSIAALAAFSGRAATSYGAFATAALDQAALMFSIATGRTTLPDDPDLQQLANYAIMEMADRLYLEQPYAATAASPFQSETIGSYTYSKGSFNAAKVTSGQKLGLLWWDLALDALALPDASLTAGGSISVFENLIDSDDEGNAAIYSPADQEASGGEVGFYSANTRSG